MLYSAPLTTSDPIDQISKNFERAKKLSQEACDTKQHKCVNYRHLLDVHASALFDDCLLKILDLRKSFSMGETSSETVTHRQLEYVQSGVLKIQLEVLGRIIARARDLGLESIAEDRERQKQRLEFMSNVKVLSEKF